MAAVLLVAATSSAVAQGNNNGGNNNGGNNNGGNNAGGILIDAEGVLQPMQVSSAVKAKRKPGTKEPEEGVVCVSLRRLNDLLTHAAADAIPTEGFVLGGLTRIDQVVVDAEARDVLLIGPGEAQLPGTGPTFVGEATGRPLMRTGDFLILLQAARTGRLFVRCSIDPEPSRLKAYNEHIRTTVGSVNVNNAGPWYGNLARILGRQVVTVGGVPDDSRVSNVLAAADYSMKRIAIGVEPSGVKEIRPQLAYAAGDKGSQFKRWWFAPQYDDVAVSPDRSVFQFSGPRAKLLAQEELIQADGSRISADRNRASTEAFARMFSEHFEELTDARPIFADLRNQFDLSITVALLVREKLLSRFDIDLRPSPEALQALSPKCQTPKFVESGSNIRKVNRGTVVGVVGGVEIAPASVLGNEAPLNSSAVRPERDAPKDLAVTQFSWRLKVPEHR
ncbi:hypothetical protein AYO47_03155 [Planctomyces sp. SCGC AG-212-M04]|nr:hypothetical protein AYO47_03155 [Planctomyces sp. SCGC AG-212-M04]